MNDFDFERSEPIIRPRRERSRGRGLLLLVVVLIMFVLGAGATGGLWLLHVRRQAAPEGSISSITAMPTQPPQPTVKPKPTPILTETSKPTIRSEQSPPPLPKATQIDLTATTWLDEARSELAEYRRNLPPSEPLPKPTLWTQVEYREAMQVIRFWQATVKPENARSTLQLFRQDIHDATRLLPRTVERWEREAYKQWLDSLKTDEGVDRAIMIQPDLRVLKIPDVQKSLRARAPWPKRKELYEALARHTGDKREWSLLHPFDDLSRVQMEQAIEAARVAKDEGVRHLTTGQRRLLLEAGQIDFLDKLLRESR